MNVALDVATIKPHKAAFPRDCGQGHSRRQKLHCRRRHDAPTVPEAARSMLMARSSLSHGSVAIMESTEWPYDKVLQLITLFQQRPMLWDTQCDAYKDRQKRHEITLELAARFNVEKDEIERKLKNLQSHFYREVKKEEKSKSLAGTGTTGVYRSKWFAFQAMKFLADKTKPRRSHTQVSSKTPATRQKPITARMSIARHSDKSRLKKSGKKKSLFVF